MKKKIIFLLITSLFLFQQNIFSTNSDIKILKLLIKNGYYDTALNYCSEKEIKTKLCYSLYLKEKRYKKLFSLISLSSNEPDNLLILLKASIKLKKYDFSQKIINNLKDLILSNSQELRLNSLIYLMNAYIFFDNYEYEKARIYFEKLKDIDSDDAEKLFIIYISLSKITKAENILKKYKLNDPFLYGLLQYKKGNYNQALLFFKKSKTPVARDYIFNCLVLLDKLDSAEKYLKKTENYKKNFYKKIKILIDYNKFDEALYRLNNSEDSYDKFFYIGKIYIKLKFYNKAIRFFKKAAKFNQCSEIFYYTGLAEFYNNRYLDAIKDFQRVINNQDNLKYFTRSLYYQGIIYSRVGMFENAENNFNRLLSSVNSYVSLKEVYRNFAIVEEMRGNFAKAIELYNNLFNLTSDKKIIIKIGEIALKLKDYEYAVKVFGNFLPVKNRKNAFILKKIADIYMEAGNYKESIKYYKRYLNITRKRNNFKILLKIGLCYLYSNDLKNAKITFLKIVELDKVSKVRDEALYWLGLIYFKEKNYLKSNIYFQRLYNANASSFLTLQAVKYILKNSINLKDYDTFKKFAEMYPEAINFNEIKKFCTTKECRRALLIKPEIERKYQFFKEFHSYLRNKNSKNINSLIEKYKEIFKNDPLIYYKIAEELKKLKLTDLAIFYYNKFLSFPYRSVYYFEVEKSVNYLINFYIKNNEFQKIIYLEEKFKNIGLKNYYNFVMGKSFYKTGLGEKAAIYLKKYIDNFNFEEDNLTNLFKASFILDNLNYYEYALKGYEIFLKYSKDKGKKVEALYWIGEIFYKQNKKLEALKYFLTIRFYYKEYSKWNIQAAFRAGNIMEEQGNIKDAVKEYKYIYYKLENGDPRKIFIKKKLEKIQNEKIK